ncbi:hypothetical protein E1264_40000 [Actinomadura sp. KC216]|uniref:hypothetical protein n=1 Tax=Actinomadura sp. KC216 TaxID=2530370 RepID=UPI00104F26BF|nr:hypothetical protein [Actinomadura sp. KC216]TDB75339.1 hypothetical protein E1264_40000 [Actinomadura sp. KC216]
MSTCDVPTIDFPSALAPAFSVVAEAEVLQCGVETLAEPARIPGHGGEKDARAGERGDDAVCLRWEVVEESGVGRAVLVGGVDDEELADSTVGAEDGGAVPAGGPGTVGGVLVQQCPPAVPDGEAAGQPSRLLGRTAEDLPFPLLQSVVN